MFAIKTQDGGVTGNMLHYIVRVMAAKPARQPLSSY